MMLAASGYLFLVLLCFWKVPRRMNAGMFLRNRVLPFLAILATVFIQGNYLQIHKAAPFQYHKRRAVRFLGVLILNAVVVFALLMAFSLIDSNLR